MRHWLILPLSLLLISCGENSAILPIAEQIAGQATTIQFVTSVDTAAIQEMRITYFPKYQPTASQDITAQLKHNPDNPQLYLAELPNLAPDEYRVAVRIVYYQQIAGVNLVRYTRVFIRDFHVYAPLSRDCYNFDDKQKDTMGWTTTPVYLDAREQPFSASGCHGVFYANQNWPTALTDTTNGGSLFIPVSDKCFPTSSPNTMQTGYWHFTLSSPSLADKPAWQNLTAVQLRVASKSINVDIRPEIVFTGGLPVGTAPMPEIRYPTYQGGWRVIEHPIVIPKGARITQLRLHISGIPENTVNSSVDAILIDGVCPVKQITPHP